MKTLLITSLCAFALIAEIHAQNFRQPDKSPMDMAYFPDNFAHDRKGDEKAIIRVTYSRPQKNDRAIFGKLVPYGKVWRCGANESTEIKLYQDIELNGKKVSAGAYSLFAIPGEKEWTIILNSDVDYWGAFKYNEQHDVLRVSASVTQLAKPLESFTIQFEGKGEKMGVMKFAWDTTEADLPFQF